MESSKPNMVVVLLSFALVAIASADWDSLGRGISTFSGELDQQELHTHVLDLGALRTVKLGSAEGRVRSKVLVTADTTRRDERQTSEGFDEFLRELEVKAEVKGSFKVFQAKVSSHYKFEEAGRTDFYYSRFSSTIQNGHIRVDAATSAQLQALVFPHVQSDFDTMTPQEIFRSYGTHVTTGVVIGGSLTLWSSSTSSKFSSEREFEVAAEASYKLVLEGSASLSERERREAGKLNSEEGLLVQGGDVALAKGNVDEWVTSINNNAEEVSFLRKGVVPIWELIADPAKANEMKSWFEKVLGSRSFFLKVFHSRPHDQTTRVQHPQARVIVEDGWKVLSGGATVKYYSHGQLLFKSCPIIESGIPKGWEAQSKDHHKADRGQIQVHAVAIHDPFDEWDVKVASATSAEGKVAASEATVPDGYTLVGGGADVKWRANTPGMALSMCFPGPTRSWYGWAEQQTFNGGKESRGTITTFAIGLKHKSGNFQLKPRLLESTVEKLQHPSETVFATDAGYAIVGGGGRVLRRSGQGVGFLTDLTPSEDGRSFFAGAKDHFTVGFNDITVYGIELQGAAYYATPEELLGRDSLSGFHAMMTRMKQSGAK